MRVFIAFELEQTIKQSLQSLQQQLEPFASKARWSRLENFHITVRFLGEQELHNVPSIIACMKSAATCIPPIVLHTSGLSCFHKKHDICYMEVINHSNLSKVFQKLQDELWRNHFIFQKEFYTPHITLGREIIWREPFAQIQKKVSIPSIRMKATGLSLMESTRIDGQLCYIPLAFEGLEERRDSK